MAQAISADTPIPLILEQLTSTIGWPLMMERVQDEINRVTRELTLLPPDTSAAGVQRLVGQIESLRWFLAQPKHVRTLYDREVKKETGVTR